LAEETALGTKCALGIDFGGTTIKTAVVTPEGKIISRGSVPTGMPAEPETLVETTVRACRDQVAAAGLSMSDIGGAGIGMPGTVNQETDCVEYANNLGMTNFPFIRKLREALEIPVTGGNDADCAALGEYMAGAGKGVRSLVLVTLGTGVGGGIVVNGKIWSGINYAAAEFGHMVIEAGGRPCNCGRRGCFEAYASASALVSQAERKAEEVPDSVLGKVYREKGHLTGKDVLQALNEGDAAAKKVFDEYVYYLAIGITNLINIFQPDRLLIGGGISNFGDVLLVPVKRMVEKYRYSRYSEKNTEIGLASLRNDAGLIGSAALTGILKV
jgi:glucokinase